MNTNRFANYQHKYNDKDDAVNIEAAGVTCKLHVLAACLHVWVG